jgi:hypothetical protein
MLTWTRPCLATSSEEVLTLDGTSMHGDATEGFLPPTWQANLKQHVLLQSGYSCHGFVAVECACCCCPAARCLHSSLRCIAPPRNKAAHVGLRRLCACCNCAGPAHSSSCGRCASTAPAAAANARCGPHTCHCPQHSGVDCSSSWCAYVALVYWVPGVTVLAPACPPTACARSNMQGAVRGLRAAQLGHQGLLW